MAPAPKQLRVENVERVSTDRQETERQRFDLDDNVAQFGLDVVGTVRIKISGSKVRSNEDWMAMQERMKRPDRDGINISALDRLCRPEDYDMFGDALRVFKEYKKVIVSAKEGLIEPWTPRGFQTCMEALLQAAKELAELKRRTAGGRRKAHAANKPMNTTAPYGILYRDKYSRDEQGHCQYFYEDLTPSSVGTSRREIVVMVFEWRYKQGWRPGSIATELNRRGILSAGYRGKGGEWVAPGAWSRSTVLQLLKNKHYIGQHWEGGKRIDVACPSFIDADTFAGVQKMTAEAKRTGKGRAARIHLLCGWLYCGACSHRYRSVTGSRRGACYSCGRVDRKRHALCHANKQVLCELLERVAWKAIWRHLTNAELLLRNAQAYYDALPGLAEKQKLEKQLAAVETRMRKMGDMIYAGRYDETEGYAKIDADKVEAEKIRASLKAAGSVMTLPPAAVVQAALNEVACVEDEPQEFDERRPILEKLVDLKMVYDQGFVEITGSVPVPTRAYKCDRGIDRGRNCVQYIPFKIKERVA
jgi:DNA invertase Pin-like site-specific DNA recombinase